MSNDDASSSDTPFDRAPLLASPLSPVKRLKQAVNLPTPMPLGANLRAEADLRKAYKQTVQQMQVRPLPAPSSLQHSQWVAHFLLFNYSQ